MVLGTEVEQMEDPSKPVGDEFRKANFMGEDLIERILLRLPISSCIRVATVSKRWYSIISSPAFSFSSIAGTQPFLFLWGLHHGTDLQTSSCMYDPVAGRWFTLSLTCDNMQPLQSPSHSYSLTNTPLGTLILYPAGNPSADISVLLRSASNPTNTSWSTSSAAKKRFSTSPIVAAVDSGGTPSSSSFEVFVLGELFNLPTVQLYNSASESWELCEMLPTMGWLYQFMGDFHVSSAVLRRNVYLANISLGIIACFSMDSKIWRPPSKLQAGDARCFLISSTNKGLYALGLCAVDEAEECVKLFKVEDATMKCKEVSKMPHHLWSLLADQFEQHTHSVLAFSYFRCVGGGNLIYVYNGSYFSKIQVCVCDINAGYSWHRIPVLPDALQHLDVRAECCSLQLLPTVCLQSCSEQ